MRQLFKSFFTAIIAIMMAGIITNCKKDEPVGPNQGNGGGGSQTVAVTGVSLNKTTLSLVENDLAPKGPVRVYIRVKDPEGILLTNGNQVSFNYQGSTMNASASREVDYEGKEVELSIYLNDIPAYEKGIYTVEAYTKDSFLGSAEVLLR